MALEKAPTRPIEGESSRAFDFEDNHSIDYAGLYERYVRSRPNLSLREKVGAFVISRRLAYESVWSDQMAHESYRPLPSGTSESYGQCVPSSCVLFSELQDRFCEEKFLLKSGRVLADTQDKLSHIIPVHVWIGWARPNFQDIGVIDLTADQSRILEPVVVASHDELAEAGLTYTEHRTFQTREELVAEFSKREAEVHKRIYYLEAALAGMRSEAAARRLDHLQHAAG